MSKNFWVDNDITFDEWVAEFAEFRGLSEETVREVVAKYDPNNDFDEFMIEIKYQERLRDKNKK